ncbi:MAG: hypothetical protein WC279_10245 [Sulfurimonas sp.]|jgi:hypothetical protein|uniref:hypothetical protein n=1 Tax=Sulfurimonas sp. TaxID=2022749 RepID=UPI00356A269C
MQVPSTSNSLYIQQGNGEYMHQAVKFGGADKIIEFTDKDSGRKIQFYSDDAMEKSLQRKFGVTFSDDTSIVKATGSFEKYLQDMWEFQINDSNTKDTNNDGYLDVKEMSYSERNVDIEFNKITKDIKLDILSFREISSSEGEALKSVENYFKDHGYSNNRITVDQDFNNLLYIDTNFDANIEDMEILADMSPQKLMEHEGLALDEKSILFSMLDEWKKKRENENETANGYANSINTIKAKDNILNKLLNNEADMSKLSEKEKSVFLQNRKSVQNSETISMEQLVQMKEKLQVSAKYINTQADNARVFSLKI